MKKSGTVEIIVSPSLINRDNKISLAYDLSREILIIARDSVSQEAKKYIADIRRSRIDICRIEAYDVPEIVYSMPKYSNGLSFENECYSDEIREKEFGVKSGLPPGLIEACHAILKLKRKHKATLDLERRNFSSSRSGDLIIRDPLFCIQDGKHSIKISDLWPEDQSSIFHTAPSISRTPIRWF